jgi:prepilin-type N-terminal cleavage/methylation domain-containing protein
MQIHTVRPGSSGERTGEAGFTVLEMLVAMILFAIVLGSIYGLLEVGRQARFNAMESNEAVQDVRVGLNTMAKDVLNAGVDYPNTGPLVPSTWLNAHLQVPVQVPAAVNLTPVVSGSQLNTLVNTTSGSPVTVKTDQVSFVSNDNTFNSGAPLNLTAMSVASTSMTISPALPPPPAAQVPQDNTVCRIGDLLVVNSAPQGNGVICLVTGKSSVGRANDTIIVAPDPLGVNDLGNGAAGNMYKVMLAPPGAATAGASRITMVTYHVVDDASGQGTGTLVRTVYGGNASGAAVASTDQPIAFDVTAMTIQYYLSDGTITGNPTAAQFLKIRQLTVNITVRSPRKDPKTGLNYVETMTSTFNTRNLGYEKN